MLKRRATLCRRLCPAVAVLLLLLILPSSPSLTQVHQRPLRAGWFQFDPYQYLHPQNDEHVTGLDVELARSALHRAGYVVTFQATTWAEAQAGVHSGELDLAMGAFHTAERAAFARFSEPYRIEVDALYLSDANDETLVATTVPSLLREISDKGLRIAVVEGYSYGATVDAFVADPKNGALFEQFEDHAASLSGLVQGRVQGLFGDSLVTEKTAYLLGLHHNIRRQPVDLNRADIHVIFSKVSVSPRIVEEFNRALQQLRDDGLYDSILRDQVTPTRMAIALAVAPPVVQFNRFVQPGNVFQVFDAIGLAAFTITGVYVAITTKSHPIWLWGPLLAALTGAGGGIIRDVVRSDAGNPMLKVSFYAEIAVIWGFLLSLYIYCRGATAATPEVFTAMLLTFFGAFVSRIAIIALRTRSPRF